MKIAIAPVQINETVTATHFEWCGFRGPSGYNPDTGLLFPACRLLAGDITVKIVVLQQINTNDPSTPWIDDQQFCRLLATMAGYTSL